MTAFQQTKEFIHPHISTLCIHADTKKTAARAQTGRERHTHTPPPPSYKDRKSEAFLGDSNHT